MAFKQVIIPKAKEMDHHLFCDICESTSHETEDHIIADGVRDESPDQEGGDGGWEDTPFSPPD